MKQHAAMRPHYDLIAKLAVDAARKKRKPIKAHRVASVLNSKRYKYTAFSGSPYVTQRGSRGIYKTITAAWRAMVRAGRQNEADAISEWIVTQHGDHAWGR